MRKMLCPQCKIAAMYVKNEAGDRRLVYVVEGGEVIPKKSGRVARRIRCERSILSGLFMARESEETGPLLKRV